MTILFGHPGGNPNSHNAALAYWETGLLEIFCVPWMPTPRELKFIHSIPGLSIMSDRLSRRSFPALLFAPRIEGRFGEWSRMARRIFFGGRFANEGLSYEANDWLMRTLRSACARPAVTAVHAYEDCSLWVFEESKRRGKACIYDLPIGYYPAWEQKQAELARNYSDWLPPGGLRASRYVRREQKIKEMELADLVLVPSTFVRRTVEQFMQKTVALCPYGVDSDFWHPADIQRSGDTLRFIYAGQCSLRKGIPILFEAVAFRLKFLVGYFFHCFLRDQLR